MAFGDKFTSRNSHLEQLKQQHIEDDDDDMEIGSDNQDSDSDSCDVEAPETATEPRSAAPVSRRPSFQPQVRTESSEAKSEAPATIASRRRRPVININEGVEDAPEKQEESKPRSRRPSFNITPVAAKIESVDEFFVNEGAQKAAMENKEVQDALHVYDADNSNNIRAKVFRMKQNQKEKFNNDFVEAVAISSENSYREARALSGLDNGLDARLNTLIDRVCEYFNKKEDEIAKIKREALRNPEVIRSEYHELFKKLVEPDENKRYQDIQSARSQYPDQYIFILVKDDKQKLVGFKKADYPAYAIYDGVTVKTVDYDRTPFGPPSELFADTDEHNEELEDAEA